MAYIDKAKTVDWATPQNFYDSLNAIYGFSLDVAASMQNHKCDDWFGLDHPLPSHRDGLKAVWSGKVWCNPPYGRVISDWVSKAAQHSHLAVCLLPARTDTKWFHAHCYKKENVKIEFIKGRLKFGNGLAPAPFPSMLVIFNG